MIIVILLYFRSREFSQDNDDDEKDDNDKEFGALSANNQLISYVIDADDNVSMPVDAPSDHPVLFLMMLIHTLRGRIDVYFSEDLLLGGKERVVKAEDLDARFCFDQELVQICEDYFHEVSFLASREERNEAKIRRDTNLLDLFRFEEIRLNRTLKIAIEFENELA